jgi:hypothetical protein
MKKHILNRPMFRQVKSPAYGTGIASNLVSNEERQKYNYGGRVRAADGLPPYRFYTDRGQKYVTDYIPQTQEDWKNLQQIKAKGLPFQTIDEINQEVQESVPGQKPWYDFSDWKKAGESTEDYAARMAYEKSDVAQDAKRKELLGTRKFIIDEHLDKAWPGLREERESVGLYTPGTDKSHPSQKGFNPKWGRGAEEIEEESVTEKPIVPGVPEEQRHRTFFSEDPAKKQNTDDLDTDADGWATLMGELDKDIEKKKQLGKGNALMQAAAAAVKWGGAPTAEKRAAAISEGLTQVGETAMKAAAEGMDLKNRAKILKGIEDVKNKKAITVQEMRGSQAMDRLKENITYLQSVSDKDGKKLGISDQFKLALSESEVSSDPLLSVSALQRVAQGEDIDINTETLDMSKPESLTKKFPPGTIIRDTKPTGKWYIAGEDGTVDQTKGYTYKAIGDWVESQAPDK